MQLCRNRQALAAQPGLNIQAVRSQIKTACRLFRLERHCQGVGWFNPVLLQVSNMQAGTGDLESF
ncbi:hypothetical protein D3C81_2031230 [compost metagenome]